MLLNAIHKGIAEEINKKRKLLSKFEKAHERIYKRLEHQIEVEANIHSARIEDENSYTKNFMTNKSNKNVLKSFKNIQAAFTFGYSNFKPGYVDENLIKGIARIVESINSDYRLVGVRPKGAIWTPPYPGKIRYEMDLFLKELNYLLFLSEDEKKKGNYIPAVEAAIFSHLHLVRIHPFEDGNGRTSRIIQNIILRYYGFPPPVIYNGEKLFYCDLLEKAIVGYRDRIGIHQPFLSREEIIFYNYIAEKINLSLDKILNL